MLIKSNNVGQNKSTDNNSSIDKPLTALVIPSKQEQSLAPQDSEKFLVQFTNPKANTGLEPVTILTPKRLDYAQAQENLGKLAKGDPSMMEDLSDLHSKNGDRSYRISDSRVVEIKKSLASALNLEQQDTEKIKIELNQTGFEITSVNITAVRNKGISESVEFTLSPPNNESTNWSISSIREASIPRYVYEAEANIRKSLPVDKQWVLFSTDALNQPPHTGDTPFIISHSTLPDFVIFA